MTIESSFIILFCVATAVAIAVRRLRIPYTVALVIAGLALGTVRPVALPHLTKELPLLRRTGMIAAVAPGHDYHVARAHLQTAAAGIAAIDHLTRSLAAPAEVLQRFRERYEERRRSAEADLRALHDAHDEVRRDASDRTVRQLLAVEQDQALEAFRSSAIDREAYHTMANDIAARIVRLERGDYDDPADLLVSPAPKSDSLVASPTDRR